MAWEHDESRSWSRTQDGFVAHGRWSSGLGSRGSEAHLPRVVCVGSSDRAIRRPGTFANSNMFARPLGASARELVRALEKAWLDVIRQRPCTLPDPKRRPW